MTPHPVLVVDDDPHMLELLEMRLDAMGFDVTATPSADEALSRLAERRFDAALFDLRMEPMDGIALTAAAHDRQARLPVIIMTAHGTIDSAVRAIKEGAFDYLTKPFRGDELRRKLTRAIAGRRWARDRDLLRQLGSTLASSSTTERTLDAVASATLEATESERVAIFLVEAHGPVLRTSVGVTWVDEAEMLEMARRGMRQGAPVRDRDPEGRALLAAPLLVDGAPHGCIVAVNPAWVVPTEEDLDVLAAFAVQASVALKNAHELSRLRSGALAALGRVATQVAHELNNPLGGLQLHASLLEERLAERGDAEGLGIIRRIEATVGHLADLATDILAFGRPAPLQRSLVALRPLVEDCVALAAGRCEASGARIDVTVSAGTQLDADPRELRKVVLNLLLNALDAPGVQHVEIGCESSEGEQGGAGAVLTIRDDGAGMTPEVRARLFDLFYTTKPTGTGLGMAIVRSAIERHGGRVEVESEPGCGTRIRCTLPAGEGTTA